MYQSMTKAGAPEFTGTKRETVALLARAQRRLRDLERHKAAPLRKAAPAVATMRGAGIVEGYAATFDRTPDAYGDVVARGAFARTLGEWARKGYPIPLLYGHRTDDPKYNIGKVTRAYEDGRGLFVRAEFDADNETAQAVRKLAKEGRLYQFSFAYSIKSQATVTLEDGTKANELRDLDLFEVSLVQIPANQRAVVTAIKDDMTQAERRAADLEDARAEARAVMARARATIAQYRP